MLATCRSSHFELKIGKFCCEGREEREEREWREPHLYILDRDQSSMNHLIHRFIDR